MKRIVRAFVAAGLLAGTACTDGPAKTGAQNVKASPVPGRTAAPATQEPEGKVKAAAVGLERFDSCPALLGYVRTEAMKAVGPYGIAGAGSGHGRDFLRTTGGPEQRRMAAPAAESTTSQDSAASAQGGVDYSETNVQEKGVDEPDIVKTDGRTLFTVSRNALYAVDVSGGAPKPAGKVDLPDGWASELLLSGDRALVFAIAPVAMPMAEPSGVRSDSSIAPVQDGKPRTTVAVVDVKDPSAMKVVTKLVLDGSYASARLAGGIARVVIRSDQPSGVSFSYPQDGTQQELDRASKANKDAVEKSTIDQWLPRYSVTEGDKVVSSGRLASCDTTYHPNGFSGFGMTTIVTLDPKDPSPRDTASVEAGSEIVYASAKNLYVATNKWAFRPVPVSRPSADDPAGAGVAPSEPVQVDSSTTEIHAFDISDPRKARYTASGSVKGRLLNQWSLSEHEDVLRAATTTDQVSADTVSASQVVSLVNRDGKLVEVGHVGDLGKGERIYAVRFIAEKGYVVTFRQVDPLYVIDLRDPAKPRVTGELKIPGYSSYLHPIADGYLLGIGQDATEEGRVQGMQASVFDVRDPAKPARLHQLKLGGSSEAEYDHKAFLWWAASKLAVLPMNAWSPDGSNPFSGAIALSVDTGSGIAEKGRVKHPDATPPPSRPEERTESYPGPGAPHIRRTVVVQGMLYTLSEAGILANDLSSLAQRGWYAFA